MVLLVALPLGVVQSSGVDVLTVRSGSMLPGIGVGERVLLDKTAYGLMLPLSSWWSTAPIRLTGPSVPAPGEIVAIRADDGSRRILIKRAIGLPGDRVEIRDGVVLVNGRRLRPKGARAVQAQETLGDTRYEVLLDDAGRPDSTARPFWVIPDGQLFVLGDNRAASTDSRHWGPIRLERLLGRIRHL